MSRDDPELLDEQAQPLEEKDEEVEDVDAGVPDAKPPTAEESLRYFGVDFDVSGLVRRFQKGDIVVPSFDPPGDLGKIEGFQRQFVWPKKQMDRFIESLLLGYPVPGIFLVEQPDRKYLVLDGQQRLRTLLAFYEGEYKQFARNGDEQTYDFALESVGDDFIGLTYANLSDADRRLLDSTLIQATVVIPKQDNLEAVYFVFERINSGGIKLQPQEIRVALYSGELIHLLRELNSNEAWRSIFGRVHSRLKDHELILRYLMLTETGSILEKYNWDSDLARKSADAEKLYQAGMNSSLNRFLQAHRSLEDLDKDKIVDEFNQTVTLLNKALGKKALRPRGNVNAAHTDAILVALTLAIRRGFELTPEDVATKITALLDDKDYLKAILESTAHLESVLTRLCIAGKTFTT